MQIPSYILDAFTLMFSAEPAVLALQIGATALSAVVIYTVLFTTRDVLIRSRSVVFQVVSILGVAVLPVVGFFLYFLVRPSQTLAERSMQKDLTEVLVRLREMEHRLPTMHQKNQVIQKFVQKSLKKTVAKQEQEATAML